MILKLSSAFLLAVFLAGTSAQIAVYGPAAIGPGVAISSGSTTQTTAGVNFTTTHEIYGAAPDRLNWGYSRVTVRSGIWRDDRPDDVSAVLSNVTPGGWYFWFDWGPYTKVLVNSVERTDYTRIAGNYIMFAADSLKAGDVLEVYQRWD